MVSLVCQDRLLVTSSSSSLVHQLVVGGASEEAKDLAACFDIYWNISILFSYTLYSTIDIELGSILGSGGFSNVLSIEASRRKSLFDENNNEDDNNTMNETNESHIIPEINEDEAICTINVNDDVTNKLTKRSSYRRSISHVNRQSSYKRSVSSQSGGSVESYAVKTLRMSIDHNKIIMGAVDLTKEAKWLNVLSHKNIISLHGTGNHPGTVDYFLVIERLQSCVRDLIGKWKREHQSLVTCGLPKEQVKNSSKRMLLKRMEICYEVCAGLSYLHGKK